MRLAWITDPHWDFADDRAKARMSDEFGAADAAVITGDLTHGDRTEFLGWVAARVPHVYYVLGNHDYYCIDPLPYDQLAAHNADGRLYEFPAWLTEHTVLFGVDGWGDGTSGTPDHSMGLSDFWAIPDLRRRAGEHRHVASPEQLAYYAYRAEHDAEQLQFLLNGLDELGTIPRRVIVACHVPPWRLAAWHQGRIGDASAAPFFVWAPGGRVIDAWADAHPAVEIIVLCGHTHSGGVYCSRPNVACYTGAARYGAPRVVSVFDADYGAPTHEEVVRTW